ADALAITAAHDLCGRAAAGAGTRQDCLPARAVQSCRPPWRAIQRSRRPRARQAARHRSVANQFLVPTITAPGPAIITQTAIDLVLSCFQNETNAPHPVPLAIRWGEGDTYQPNRR